MHVFIIKTFIKFTVRSSFILKDTNVIVRVQIDCEFIFVTLKLKHTFKKQYNENISKKYPNHE